MDFETRVSIEIWVDRAERSDDPFVRFFILYMCLDAWMTLGSALGSDNGKKAWIKKGNNYLRLNWSRSPDRSLESIMDLRRLSPVENLRPPRTGDAVHLRDVENFSEIFDFIYQIRCNLFHGGKMAMSARDHDLVTAASKVLDEWIDCLLKDI